MRVFLYLFSNDKESCQNILTRIVVNAIVRMTRKVVKGARAYAIT